MFLSVLLRFLPTILAWFGTGVIAYTPDVQAWLLANPVWAMILAALGVTISNLTKPPVAVAPNGGLTVAPAVVPATPDLGNRF